jgi:hypothetical protein
VCGAHPTFKEEKTPEQIWYKEVGAPVARIYEPLEGYVLTPQIFSTSYLVLGPVLHCSGSLSLSVMPIEHQ